MTKNQNVLKWVEEMKALTQPDKVVWIDGSEEQLKALRDEAIATGEMIELNQEKLPGCLYHRTAENDVARVEDRTFICSREKENAGPTNNWVQKDEMYARMSHQPQMKACLLPNACVAYSNSPPSTGYFLIR